MLFFTNIHSLDVMIISHLSFKDLSRCCIPLSRAWYHKYCATYPQSHANMSTLIIPSKLHKHISQLSQDDINSITAFLQNNRYLKSCVTAGYVAVPPLPHLIHLDLWMPYPTTHLLHINSTNFPSLRHLTLREPENVELGSLHKLTTLELFTNTFHHSADYITEELKLTKLSTLIFHGSVCEYSLPWLCVSSVTIETGEPVITFSGTGLIRQVTLIHNPTLPTELFSDNCIVLKGNLSNITDLTVIGSGLKMKPNLKPNRCPRLTRFRVYPAVTTDYSFTELAVVCRRCYCLLTDVLKCGRCCLATYCSRTCQVRDWSTHKRTCGK